MFKCKHLPPKHKVTCELTNLIYIINCKKCGHQYIGETKRPFRNRMYEHHSSVQKFSTDKSTPVSRHFSQKDHSVKHMEFSILHWMGDPINPNTTQIGAEAKNYITFGHSPHSTQQASTCLYEAYALSWHPLPRCPLFSLIFHIGHFITRAE